MFAAVSRLGVACVAIVCAIALAACGTIDADKLEDEIADGVSGDLERFEVTATSVACPDDVESETGATFECTIITDTDEELIVEVEVTDGDNGDVEYRFAQKSLRELAFGGGGQGGKTGS
jgi:hypothetical protein